MLVDSTHVSFQIKQKSVVLGEGGVNTDQTKAGWWENLGSLRVCGRFEDSLPECDLIPASIEAQLKFKFINRE